MTNNVLKIFIFVLFGSIYANAENVSTPYASYEPLIGPRDTFVDSVDISSKIRLLLSKDERGANIVRFAHHDGKIVKINLTALQYSSDQRRNQEKVKLPEGLTTRLASQRILTGDFNENGKQDVAYVSSAYEELIAAQTDSRETSKKVDWGGYECGNFDLLLSLDNMDSVLAIHFDDGKKLDIGGMRDVLIEEHSPALRASAPVSENTWKLIRDKILTEKSGFNCVAIYNDMYFSNTLLVVDTLNWIGDATENSSGTINLTKALEEHKKTLAYYNERHMWPSWAFSAIGAALDIGDHVLYEADPNNLNAEYTEFLNDLAFFLSARKKQRIRESAIPILAYVIKRDPSLTIAYLNLADAQYDAKLIDWPDRLKLAATLNYREYHKRMVAAGKKDQIPARVLERMK